MKDWIPFEHGYYKQNGKTVTFRLKQHMPKDWQMKSGRSIWNVPMYRIPEKRTHIPVEIWEEHQPIGSVPKGTRTYIVTTQKQGDK